ncbi:MAG TPA: S8 family serine peptidase [Frankiaceae bacterium]|nr:S8 family serine peptidase [Frankiaceae bacterium]
MRARIVLVAASLIAGGVVAAPATALLPSVCNVAAAPVDTRAMVAYDASPAALRAVRAAGGRVVGGIERLDVLQVAFPSRVARDAALPVVRRAPGVRYAEAERVFSVHRNPNDTFWRYQWGLFKIGAMKAWNKETGGKTPVTVAVLDTGVDLKHPDLAGRVIAGDDIVANDPDPSDDHGHGTHVAGIVAAKTNNRVGVAGMSWGAKVLAVKVLAANGEGSDCDIALGMVGAADAGARVLNMSLGSTGTRCGLVTQAAIDYARDAGSLPVVSAGNSGSAKDGNPVTTPANCDGVLTVGATDPADKIAKFSTHHPYVDVSAPGVGILSTGYQAMTGRHTYVAMSGTSMAAPYVAGLAALLMSRNPTWTPDQVMDRIVKTSDDRGTRGKDDYFGAGRVNAARAIG